MTLLLLDACTWIDADDLAERLDDGCDSEYGLCLVEALPDTTVAPMLEGTSTLDGSGLVAQDAGTLSAVGRVDSVTGTCVLDASQQGWNRANDSDAFTFHVPAPTRVRLDADWPDPDADLDFGIWYDDADLGFVDLFSSGGPGSCLTGDHPSECVSDYVLDPEVTYQLLVMGYLGTDEQAYSMTLEWLAP